MSYSIRQWMTCGNVMFDEKLEAKTAEEAIACCRKLAGIYKSVVSDMFAERVKALEVGKTAKIHDGALKLTIIVRRRKR